MTVQKFSRVTSPAVQVLGIASGLREMLSILMYVYGFLLTEKTKPNKLRDITKRSRLSLDLNEYNVGTHMGA